MSAQIDLGYMYDESLSVLQDYAEAVRWYRNSAEQKVIEAYMWLSLAASQGQEIAIEARDKSAGIMTTAQTGKPKNSPTGGDLIDKRAAERREAMSCWCRLAWSKNFIPLFRDQCPSWVKRRRNCDARTMSA